MEEEITLLHSMDQFSWKPWKLLIWKNPDIGYLRVSRLSLWKSINSPVSVPSVVTPLHTLNTEREREREAFSLPVPSQNFPAENLQHQTFASRNHDPLRQPDRPINQTMTPLTKFASLVGRCRPCHSIFEKFEVK
jgi:hypothetical protein